MRSPAHLCCSSKLYEVCEYVSKTEHINLFNMVICGQAWFDKLPAEYQEVMKKDFHDCAYNNASGHHCCSG